MYGLAYCKLDYDTLHEIDGCILDRLIEAQINKEIHEYDLDMQKIAWQTAYLMNSTGNYKRPVKPDKLYTPIAKQGEQKKNNKKIDVKSQREELMKKFGLNK
ncbi:hypothetical protein SDC9_128732 [bioreactor metagenome]|uniref:Uncharacterized protein n=1 Tax=bioreactor metagenome TaxID=1076179 RepID=A0A645CXU9_9ZZZZ